MEGDLDTASSVDGRAQVAALVLCALLGGAGLLVASLTGGLLACILALFLLLGVRVYRRPRPGNLGLVAKAFGAFCALTLLIGAGMVAMWESAEVIDLRQRDENGETFSTRLWIVEFDGHPSIAARPPDSQRRIALLRDYPRVEMVRDGHAECRRAVLLPVTDEVWERVRQRYTDKYGVRAYAAGRLVGLLLGGRPKPEEREILIQFEPCEGGPSGA
jgi:hypothetical protein